MTALGGRPLIAYPLEAALATGLEVAVIAKRCSVLPPLDCELVLEPDLPRHPLCGIVAALKRGGGRPVVVLACDMPFLTASLLQWLAGQRGPAVAQVDGFLQPLLARYVPANLPALERALGERASLRATVARIDPVRVDEHALVRFGDPRRLCFNVNDTRDLQLARRWLAGEQTDVGCLEKRTFLGARLGET